MKFKIAIAAIALLTMMTGALDAQDFQVRAFYMMPTDADDAVNKMKVANRAVLDAKDFFTNSFLKHLKPHELRDSRLSFHAAPIEERKSDKSVEWFETIDYWSDVWRELGYNDRASEHQITLIFIHGMESFKFSWGEPTAYHWIHYSDNSRDWDTRHLRIGGAALFCMDAPVQDWSAYIAHYLGHLYGLDNNRSDDATMNRSTHTDFVVNRGGFSRMESLWLSQTRHFKDAQRNDIDDFAGTQLVHHELTPNGKSVKFVFRITSHVGVKMLFVSTGSRSEVLRWRVLDRWQTESVVTVPVSLLKDEVAIRVGILNQSGAYVLKEHAYTPPQTPALPHGAPSNQSGRPTTSWARIKTATSN